MSSQYQTPAPQTSVETQTNHNQQQGSATGQEATGVHGRDPVDGVPLSAEPGAAEYRAAIGDATRTAEQLVALAARLAQRKIGEASTLYTDDATMNLLAARVSVSQMVEILRYWRAPLALATRRAGRAGTLTLQNWGLLVSGKSADECLAAIQDETAWALIRALNSSDPANLFPLLTLDPAKYKQGLTTKPAWVLWIVEVNGMDRLVEIFTRIGEFEADKQLRENLRTYYLYDAYLLLHPRPTTNEREARRLYNWLLCTTDTAEAVRLFKARFAWDLQNQAPVEDNPSTEDKNEEDPGANWDYASIVRCWQICARLPPEQVLSGIRFIREEDRPGTQASGWARGSSAMGMDWGTDVMGEETEVGSFTDDRDPMRGLNVFDATLRHEIGHTVADRNGFDESGGFVQTMFGWKEFAFHDLLEELKGLMPVDRQLTADEATSLMRGLENSRGNYTRDNYEKTVNQAGNDDGHPNLWQKARTTQLARYLVKHALDGAWDEPGDIGGNSYHLAYAPGGKWVSYPTPLWAKKVSTYAMRSPGEWFAECYATFYAEADQPEAPVGRLLAQKDPRAYAAFLIHVHRLFNLGKMTGQNLGHGTMGV